MTELPQKVRFLMVGGIATGLDALLFASLVWGGADPRMANMASYALSAVAAFWLHRNWTFSARNGAASVQALRFTVMVMLGLLLTTTLVWLAAPIVGPLPAKAIAILGSVTLNFVLCRRLVFATGFRNGMFPEWRSR